MRQAVSNESAQGATRADGKPRFLDQFLNGRLGAADAGAPLQLGHIGRSPAAPEGASIYGTGFATGTETPFRVVSFYTAHNQYADHAARLRESLERHGVPHSLVPVDTTGSWEATCAFKASFVRDMWRQASEPIVWLDADATVEAPPRLFGAIDADFAAHKWDGWTLAGGTLYFGRGDLARTLIDRWVLRCEADPQTWDQVHLHSAWCDVAASAPLRTVWLPRAYCQIFDKAKEDAPVIRHWQASRAEKRSGRKTVPAVSISPQGQADRRDDRLWRGPVPAGPGDGAPGAMPDGLGRLALAAAGRHRPVLEIGCGDGRLAGQIDPADYLGLEADPAALRAARARCPAHAFRIADAGYSLPDAPSVLVHAGRLPGDEGLAAAALRAVAVGRRRVILWPTLRRETADTAPDRRAPDWTRIAKAAGLKSRRILPAGARDGQGKESLGTMTVLEPDIPLGQRIRLLLRAGRGTKAPTGFVTPALLAVAQSPIKGEGTDATA